MMMTTTRALLICISNGSFCMLCMSVFHFCTFCSYSHHIYEVKRSVLFLPKIKECWLFMDFNNSAFCPLWVRKQLFLHNSIVTYNMGIKKCKDCLVFFIEGWKFVLCMEIRFVLLIWLINFVLLLFMGIVLCAIFQEKNYYDLIN